MEINLQLAAGTTTSTEAPVQEISIQEIFISLAEAVSSGQESSAVASSLVDNLCKFFQVERAGVFLLNDEKTLLHEFAGQLNTFPMVIPVNESLCGLAVETGLPQRIGQISNASRYIGDPGDMRSFLAAPLTAHDGLLGVLMLESSQPERFSQADEDLLMAIAKQLAGVLLGVKAFNETRSWAANLDLIHRVVQRIIGLTDEAEIAQVTAELMASFFGYEVVAVLVPDETGKYLINLGSGGQKAILAQRFATFPSDEGIIGKVFQSRRNYFSNDVTQDPYYYGLPGWEAGSEMCTLLREGDEVVGLLNLERARKGSFSKQDRLAVESLAAILAAVMMSARRQRQVQNSLNQLRAVRDTSLDIIANLDLETLLRRVVHRARLLVDAPGAEIGLVEEDGIRVQTTENPWYEFSGHLIPIGKGIAGQVLATGNAVVTDDYNSWSPRLWPGTHVGFKAVAGVPLRFHDQVIGTLVVMDDRDERVFSANDLQVLELLAQNIAIAIRNAQLYEELRERIETQRLMEARLVQSEKITAAGRLTASIAHEINNPLQAVQNALYLADREELPQDQRHKYLLLARSELERLVTTVQRMLEFYRPGAKDRQRIQVNAVVQRVLDLIGPQLDRKQIKTVTQLADGLPDVYVVPNQIQQVLINLIINAMDAMPDGGTLTVKTGISEAAVPKGKKRSQGRLRSIEITIRDSGHGVPVPLRERIFEPFVSTKETGTGLGLSVSYGIIQAHGGLLSLVEDDLPGACFRITLPEEAKNEITNNGS